jgi:tetratricopeptide (TPR) repeat protein
MGGGAEPLHKVLRLLLFVLTLMPLTAKAQINTDKVIMVGRNALYYEDYVLSIQYFNQVISSKPWLYEAYFYRGLAKYYLDDYQGGEDDCTAAIDRDPFVSNIYQVRGLCRINLGKYGLAAEDYREALKYDPENQGLWQNLSLCLMEDKRYDEANEEIDHLTTRWPKFAKGYAIKAQVAFLQKDTLRGTALLDTALVIDPYDGEGWSSRAMLSLQKEQYKEGEQQLDKAIHLMPKVSGNYINRALARYNQKNLRGAMADYDMALDLDPNNYLGHFNRALLRAQVGDDNRAIVDFNFVLKQEPDNMIALFNRALLLDKTGDYRGAIRDITRVIKSFPNFWTGYMYRARIRRKIGDTRGAEFDEFKVLKAEMEKRYGGKSNTANRHVRRKSDQDIDNYNQLVVADKPEEEHRYASDYRGRVQDRTVSADLEPLYTLSYYDHKTGVQYYVAYHKTVDELNRKNVLGKRLLIARDGLTLDSLEAQARFASIRKYSQHLNQKPQDAMAHFGRALDYYLVQDFENAILDLNKVVELQPSSTLAYFLRAVVKMKQLEVQRSEATEAKAGNKADAKLKGTTDESVAYGPVLDDLKKVITLSPDFTYAYYDEGEVYSRMHDFGRAIDAYTQAIRLDSHLPEAYYNRGITSVLHGDKEKGLLDLSKAGELGMYKAYSLMRQYGGEAKTDQKSKSRK